MTKKVYSEIEKMELIRKYEEAQVSMAKFAKEKGVPFGTAFFGNFCIVEKNMSNFAMKKD